MFVRKKINRSGSTSVVAVDKSSGKLRYLATIGVSSDATELAELYRLGKKWVSDHTSGKDMFKASARENEERQTTERFLSNVENILLNGTQLLLNRVFHRVGFDRIDDEILKHLVVARLCQPSSKPGTVDYLQSYFEEDIELHNIYRYLDRLYNTQQDKIQQISVEHTKIFLAAVSDLYFMMLQLFILKQTKAMTCERGGFQKTENTLNRRLYWDFLSAQAVIR